MKAPYVCPYKHARTAMSLHRRSAASTARHMAIDFVAVSGSVRACATLQLVLAALSAATASSSLPAGAWPAAQGAQPQLPACTSPDGGAGSLSTNGMSGPTSRRSSSIRCAASGEDTSCLKRTACSGEKTGAEGAG